MPTVSVIIPFYNRVAWLREAVQSVLAQTYSDFEIIIVNDGSSEAFNPFDFFDDKRISYVEQENKGPAAARNVGIDRAQGKYIAFLDADDLFVPEKLETQVRCMEENPDVVLSHTNYTKITDNADFLEEVESGRFSGVVYPKIITHCPIATPTVMVRYNVLNSHRFIENVRIGEDIMLWLSIAKINRIFGIRESLSKVRIHGENAASNPEVQLTANFKILDYAIANDTTLNKLFRQKSISSIYLNVGMIYFELHENYKAISCILKSLVYNPLNFFSFLYLLYFMLPKPVRIILRNFIIYFRQILFKTESTRIL